MLKFKPIRVALSGSGFKFPAHVGALHALADAGYDPIEYAGTSGGSIIAALAAHGMHIDDMKALAMNRDWSNMLSWFEPISLVFKKGICSGANLLSFIDNCTDGKTFAELDTDLTIMASDMTNGLPFEFSRKTTPNVKVSLAARASASIPDIYTPIIIGDIELMDGGIENNIPADKLKIDGVPRIGIQLVAKGQRMPAKNLGLINSIPRLVDMMLDANENTHVDLDAHEGTHFAFVETGFCSGLDRNMDYHTRKLLFDNGYMGARAALENIF